MRIGAPASVEEALVKALLHGYGEVWRLGKRRR
jgi:hypothetical protein